MRSFRRIFVLFATLSFIAVTAGCDSIDLSGFFFDGNHPAEAAPSFEVAEQAPNLVLRFHGVTLKEANTDPGSNEITLRFAGNADPNLLADIQKSRPDWILGTQVNGDSGTVVARKDVTFATAKLPDGFTLTLTPRAPNDAAPPVAAPTAPVQTAPLHGTNNLADILRSDADEPISGNAVDGLQNEDLRGAFGVDETPEPRDTTL